MKLTPLALSVTIIGSIVAVTGCQSTTAVVQPKEEVRVLQGEEGLTFIREASTQKPVLPISNGAAQRLAGERQVLFNGHEQGKTLYANNGAKRTVRDNQGKKTLSKNNGRNNNKDSSIYAAKQSGDRSIYATKTMKGKN